MKKKTLKVGGMSCTACASRIERRLKKTPGIETATVNFAAETLTAEIDETLLSWEDVRQAVETSGYSILKDNTSSEPSSSRTQQLLLLLLLLSVCRRPADCFDGAYAGTYTAGNDGSGI